MYYLYRYQANNNGCILRLTIVSVALLFAIFIILITHRPETLQSHIKNMVSPVQKYFSYKKDYFEEDFHIAAMLGNLSEQDINLFKKLKSIRLSCGEICDTTIRGEPGKVNSIYFRDVVNFT